MHPKHARDELLGRVDGTLRALEPSATPLPKRNTEKRTPNTERRTPTGLMRSQESDTRRQEQNARLCSAGHGEARVVYRRHTVSAEQETGRCLKRTR